MGQLIAPDYGQQFLLPPAVEDWVGPQHPARFVREFIEALDLREYGINEEVASEGRPRYAASLLLKVWVYGYLHKIRTTRKLEAACRDQLPLIWLTGMIQPDHNSLWRFWRAHKVALRAVYHQTVKVAVHSGCVGLVLQAVDGTKIASWASSRTGWNKARMEKLLAALDEGVHQLELQVAHEPEESVSYQLPAGLEGRQA